MVKEPCTKFCGVLICSHKVMKLQSFQFGVGDIIIANVQNISLLVFFACFLKFYGKKNLLQSVIAVLTISLECMKLQIIE